MRACAANEAFKRTSYEALSNQTIRDAVPLSGCPQSPCQQPGVESRALASFLLATSTSDVLPIQPGTGVLLPLTARRMGHLSDVAVMRRPYRGIGPWKTSRAPAAVRTAVRRPEPRRRIVTTRKRMAMDDLHWFDTFHRKFVRDVDRRGLLRATASMAAILVANAVPPAAATKNRKQKGNGNGNKKGKGHRKGKGNRKDDVKPQTDFCTDAPDDRPCAGDCGVCFNGSCVPLSNACPPCHRCDENFTCVSLPEGSGCGGDCGTCQDGRCLPDGRRCRPCGGCDATTLTCVADPDLEGSDCDGLCSTCINGRCLPDGTRCGPCEACDGSLSICVANHVVDGQPCGQDKVCDNGACVDVGSCPTVPACREVVWDVVAGRYVQGRLLECCDHTQCEICDGIPDPGSPTGYRCDEFDQDGRCLRQPLECRSVCSPEHCQTCVAGQGYCESVCDVSRQVCRAGTCTCVPAGEPCPAGGAHYCCSGTCPIVAQRTVCG